MALTITKTIRPNATWQEMYLQIKLDQRVIIAAEGLWSPESRPQTIIWCGADGIVGGTSSKGQIRHCRMRGFCLQGVDENQLPVLRVDFRSPAACRCPGYGPKPAL